MESALQKLINRCEGNPLILKIASSTIEALFKGDVKTFLDCTHILYGSIYQLIEQQFQRLSKLEQQILNYLILEDSKSISKLSNNAKLKMSPCRIIEALESLQGRSLIEIIDMEAHIQPILVVYLKQKLLEN